MIGLERSDKSLVLCEVQVFYESVGKYKLFNNFKMYEDAQNHCKKYFDGYLMKIETKEEYDYVRENIFKKEKINFSVLSGHTTENKNDLYPLNDGSGKK